MDEQNRAEYALALRQGKERFGSPCPHSQIRRGFCIKCKRRVRTMPVTRRVRKGTTRIPRR